MTPQGAYQSLTIDDLLALQHVGDAQIDPSGTRIAFVIAANFAEYAQPAPESRVWLVPAEGGPPSQLTQGPGTDDLPRWSPNGSMLAFRSDRFKRGTGQLYLLRADWAEARPLPAFERGVTAYGWSPDSTHIAVIAPEDPPRATEQEAATGPGDDAVLFEDEPQFGRVWLVDVSNGTRRQITDGPVHVWELAWSPDSRTLAAIVSDLPFNWSWYRARLVRIDVETGAMADLYAPTRQITHPAWSPDGSATAVISCTWSDPGMTGGDVILVPAAGGDARNLTEGKLISHLSLHWQPDSQALLTSAWDRGRAAVCLVDRDGRTRTLWSAERAFVNYGVSTSADGCSLAAAISDPTHAPEVWVGRIEPNGTAATWEPRTTCNAAIAERALGRTETLTWRAADGLEIQGLLVRPVEREVARAAPMVTLIHGGPTGAWTYAFPGAGVHGWVQLLTARGIAVFLPNPRGSNGWGVPFAELNHGDLGGTDLQDILAGIDYCISQSIADAKRLGVGGWSYGGYLTAWAITQTDRFKAAVAGASITNWFSFHGGTDIPAFDEIFLRANPYSLDGRYATRSPIFAVDQVQTPTLFLHGEQDPCCPVGQAYEMARGLRRRGVEVRCVVYPREGHGPRERLHRRDLLERGVGWFADHLDR